MVGAVAEQQPALEMAAEHRLPAALGGEIAGLVEQDELVGLRPDELHVPAAAGVEAVDRPVSRDTCAGEGERIEHRLGQGCRSSGSPRLAGHRREVAAAHDADELVADDRRLLAMGDRRQEMGGHEAAPEAREPTRGPGRPHPVTTGVGMKWPGRDLRGVEADE
jgi:hypothetical protein